MPISKSLSCGFALAEALVALFLLTLGVMGGALMHLHALRSGQQARMHTSAVLLAAELAESMALSTAAAARRSQASPSLSPFLAIDIDLAAGRGAPPLVVNCFGTQATCSGAAWADFEIAEWGRRLVAQLPNARAVVCRDDAPWDAAAQAFAWRCGGQLHGAIVIKLGWRGAGAHPASDAAPQVVLRVAEGA